MPYFGSYDRSRIIAIIIGAVIVIAGLFFIIRGLTGNNEPAVNVLTNTPSVPPASTASPYPTETAVITGKYTVKPGDSIQKVLNEMPGGETCFIFPGIYQESLIIPKSGQTIRKAGEGDVIIDGGGAANAVLINKVSDTTLQGLIIRNSGASLILITGSEASRNTVKQCTLLEWGLDGVSCYPGAVDSSDGASYTTVDLCYIDRGNHEAIWTQNQEAISYHYSGGHHTVTNNIVWGICRDASGNLIKAQENFGDGYPLYKFNIFDGICGLDGKDRLDFDGTIISGNHFYGAHDDIIGVQGLDRNCTISNNYIDSMGGAVCIVLRGASIGPVNVVSNICVNAGINCFKYASWENGSGMAQKYLLNNIYYSTLTRGYTSTESTWYIPILDKSYNRFIDGEVNEADYDNLTAVGNYAFCRTYFLSLMPGSGNNNVFSDNHFSTDNNRSCIKWFSNNSTISFDSFNSLVGGTNIWEVISKPSEPALPDAGAG